MYYILLFIYLFKFVYSHDNISEDKIQHIIHMHNDYRSNGTIISASNMIKMEWNEFLESEALSLVETCVYTHSTNGYGQNLYRTSNLDVDVAIHNGIMAWYNEIDIYRDSILENINNSNEVGIGLYDHVSQILWADSYLVGCAYSLCNFGVYFVCNYSPTGNFIGKPWFISGEHCSNCPEQFSFCDDKLCSRTPPLTNVPSVVPTISPIPAPVPTILPAPAPVLTKPIVQPTLPQVTTPVPTELVSLSPTTNNDPCIITIPPFPIEPPTLVPTTEAPTLPPVLPPCVIIPPDVTFVQYIPIEIPICVVDENISVQEVIDNIVCKQR